jgi:hypothetical protein
MTGDTAAGVGMLHLLLFCACGQLSKHDWIPLTGFRFFLTSSTVEEPLQIVKGSRFKQECRLCILD